MLPVLRQDLAVTDLDSELLVYDPKVEKAHCFSKLGREVFLCLKEGLGEEQILARLATDPQVVDAAQVLAETLLQMRDEGLLDAQDSSEEAGSFDRRRFLTAATAVAAPILLSSFAPSPAHAASCKSCSVFTSGPQIGTPTDCTTCGLSCPTTSCVPTSLCSFEYVIATVDGVNPVNPAGTSCTSYHTSEHGPLGANYLCRSFLNATGYTPNSTFRYDCQAARDFVLGQPGNHGNERYYCCFCTGPASAFSCP